MGACSHYQSPRIINHRALSITAHQLNLFYKTIQFYINIHLQLFLSYLCVTYLIKYEKPMKKPFKRSKIMKNQISKIFNIWVFPTLQSANNVNDIKSLYKYLHITLTCRTIYNAKVRVNI